MIIIEGEWQLMIFSIDWWKLGFKAPLQFHRIIFVDNWRFGPGHSSIGGRVLIWSIMVHPMSFRRDFVNPSPWMSTIMCSITYSYTSYNNTKRDHSKLIGYPNVVGLSALYKETIISFIWFQMGVGLLGERSRKTMLIRLMGNILGFWQKLS